METTFRFRGHDYNSSHFDEIQRLIDANPKLSRRKLSVKLCESWGWRQPNGHTRDMVCRSFMLALHRAGHITLPEKRCSPNNPIANRQRPDYPKMDESPLSGQLDRRQGVDIELLRDKDRLQLHDSLVEHHHYLAYSQPVGHQIKYLIHLDGRTVGAISFSSPPRHIGARDRFIGWDQHRRKSAIHLLAYNTRFLVLPWVQVPHLASHILGKVSRRIAKDWLEIHGHPVYLLETFVDTEKFAGTCYKAANWISVGQTKGVGKNSQTKEVDRSIKDVMLLPLHKQWQHKLLNETV